MPATLQEAVPFILLALALLVAVWVLFRASRKTKVIGEEKGDVLDEGAGPASRNQALIDAAPSTSDDSGVPLKTEAASEPQEVVPDAPTPAPAPAPTPSPTPAAADDLKRIKGLGPKLVAILAEQGITSFAQIASWDTKDIERIDATLGRFAGRITRDQWVEQAKLLADGDDSRFSATFGNHG